MFWHLNDDVDSDDGQVWGLRQLELLQVWHRVPLEQRVGDERLIEVGEKLKKTRFPPNPVVCSAFFGIYWLIRTIS